MYESVKNEDPWRGRRAISLVRQSDNTLGNQSVEAQGTLMKSEIERMGMVFVDSIVLAGVTGSMPGRRTDLDELLQRKRERDDFDVVAVQLIDRMTRGGASHGIWIEHEFARHGIELYFVGEDVPQGEYGMLFRAMKYEAAQGQAKSISARSAQGSQYALEEGRLVTCSKTPFGCDRLYLSPGRNPLHRTRDLRDGRQLKLSPDGQTVMETLGQLGDNFGSHYRKQKHELVTIVPGDEAEQATVKDIIRWHFVEGLGGKRIADRLNVAGVRAPRGGKWSQRQVESLYENPVYTGRSAGNTVSTAIYHERNPGKPRPTGHTSQTHATAAKMPKHHRPPEEWVWQLHAEMKTFLDENLRQQVIAEHDAMFDARWQRRLDGTAVMQKSKSKHQNSDYLLSGLLVAQQDLDAGGKVEPMVGHRSGERDGPKTRYYRHKKGHRDYVQGSFHGRLIPAEPLEDELLKVLREVLLQLPDLEAKLLDTVTRAVADQASAPKPDLDNLHAERDAVKRKRRELVTKLDPDTLADVQDILDELLAEARKLDRLIADAKAADDASTLDPKVIVAGMIAQLYDHANKLDLLPNAQLKQLVASMVEPIVDLQTKQVELTFHLPDWTKVPRTVQNGDSAVCLEPSSRSPAGHETHPPCPPALLVVLATYTCQYLRVWGSRNTPCYECRRQAA